MLAVGSRESLKFSDIDGSYETVDRDARIYRKVRQ